MRKTLLTFLLAMAGFLALLLGFTEALRLPSLARFAFLRPLLILAGILFFGRWIIKILHQSRLLPESWLIGMQNTMRAISGIAHRLIFSSRIGFCFACVVFGFVTFFLVWYASLGLFPKFPNVGNLYIDQAEAFLKGQTALIETPSPQILALSDPYSFDQRNGVPYLWDASLYHGKYYLYWGPVPSVILAIIMALTGVQVPDSLFVILAAVGILAVVFVLLWEIRRRFYPQAPTIFIGLFLVAVIINLPFLFLLGRGRVYETSIIAGQFFLLLGLAGYLFYTRSQRPGWLSLAGLSWGLSIACRYNLAISVAVFLGFLIFSVWRSVNKCRAAMTKLAYLIIPFSICILGLGLFNWVRFDNPFETGLSYQLTAPVYQNQHFSLAYLRSNLYLNVLYPYRKVEQFPLIRSIAVVPENAPGWAGYHPGKRHDETILGFGLVPFFWILGLLPLLGGVWWAERRRQTQPSSHRSDQSSWLQIAWMIGLAGLLQFCVLMLYYYSAVRFMADFYLLWLLTAVFLIWSLDRRLIGRPWLRTVLWTVVTLAILSTALLGFLGGFDNPPQVFHIYNPNLEAKIAEGWNSIYTSQGAVGKSLRYLLMLFL